MTTPALNDLQNSTSAINFFGLRGHIESALTRWTLGQLVFADENGKPRFLKRLCAPPPEVWEIRVTEPIVHARLLGRFAEPDTLILTHHFTRQLLGQKGSQAWTTAMSACVQSWEELFPNVAPFAADSVQKYVTENCDDFPLC